MDAQSREIIKQNAISLPLVEHHDENAKIIDGFEAITVWRALRNHGSAIPDHVHAQVEDVLDEVTLELHANYDKKHFLISEVELRGILSRMAIRGAAQGLNDVGGILRESHELNQLLLGPDEAA